MKYEYLTKDDTKLSVQSDMEDVLIDLYEEASDPDCDQQMIARIPKKEIDNLIKALEAIRDND